MQLVEDARVLPALQAAPAGLSGAEAQLQRQLLPGDAGVEHEQHALQAKPVRHWPRTGRALGPGRQHRPDQCPQLVVHDPRLDVHTITNGSIVAPVTAGQRRTSRSCYELIAELVIRPALPGTTSTLPSRYRSRQAGSRRRRPT